MRPKSDPHQGIFYVASLGMLGVCIAIVLFAGILVLTPSCSLVEGSGDEDQEVGRYQGRYSGEASYAIPSRPQAPVKSFVTLDVVQQGALMTISGEETLRQGDGLLRAVPAITGTVSITGAFTPQSGSRIGTWEDLDCGRSSTTRATFAFVDTRLSITETIVTPNCGNVLFSAKLVKGQ